MPPVIPPTIQVHSTSDLPSARMTKSTSKETTNSEPPPDLLESLLTRPEFYRNLKLTSFNTPKSTLRDYEQRVSFDTIDISYEGDDDDESEYGYDWNDLNPSYGSGNGYNRGRSRGRSPSPSHMSPLGSPSGGGLLSTREGMDLVRMLSPRRPEYPTQPIITHKGCTFTKFHKDFDILYQNRLQDSETGRIIKPVLAHRVILVYVSGRKHTWVSLDWILSTFIETGDTIIVVAAIKDFETNKWGRRKSYEPPKNTPLTPKMRSRQRHRPENIKVISRNIMDYMLRILKPGVIAKLSVEICVGPTKEILKEMYKLYEPNLVSTGTKPNTRISAPLRSWNSSKITDRLVKNFPLPLIVVPAVNMPEFELRLEQDKLNTRIPISEAKAEADHGDDKKPSDDASDSLSDSDTESTNSIDSCESYSSYDEIAKLYTDYKKDIHDSIVNLRKKTINEEYYSRFLTTISDKSIQFCKEVRDVDPDFKGRGAKLARAITGSNSFGSVPYKTKSLLAPLDPPKPANTSGPGTPALSYKELKKLATRNLETTPTNGSLPPPAIEIHSPSDGPKRSAIKFGNLESPPRKESPSLTPTSKMLQKSLSHDIDSSSSRPKLEPTKSQPDITGVLGGFRNASSEELGKGKKKKKFWKIF